MKLSKTMFINYMRCNRYPALDDIYRDKERAVVSFSDDPELEDLMGKENREKVHTLLQSMYDDDIEEDEEEKDLLVKDDPQMDVMMPYYKKIEVIAGQMIENRFKGDVTYSLDTHLQKRLSFEKDGFHFYCFLDGYQEDNKTIRIIEIKATTSNKFIKIDFKADDKEKYSVFEKSPEGILMLQEDLGGPINDKYHTKVKNFMNRLDKVGRYIYDIAYQRYVFEHAITTKKDIKFYLGVLNAEYVHEGLLDNNQEPKYTDDVIQLIDVTSLTHKMMDIIDQDFDKVIHRLNTMQANPVSLGAHCQRKDKRQCLFYPICYKHIPEKNSIFTYLQNHNGFTDENGTKHDRFDLINEGNVSAFDIPHNWLTRDNNKIQRQVMDTDVPFYDKNKIKAGIDALTYPIYHLDFETFPCPLPRFKGEVPYAQSLFQFSIHIEHAPGVCDKEHDNVSFIATTHLDQRRELIEKMLETIKEDGGSILVYNQSFEQTRLKEMAQIFPEYSHRLHDMINRLFDLMHLLRGNSRLFKALGFDEEDSKKINYYHNDLNGSFSIKKVLPLFSNLNYYDLDIANGTDALVAYATFPLMNPIVFEKTYQDLLKYCQQDTWAMVEILNALRKII